MSILTQVTEGMQDILTERVHVKVFGKDLGLSKTGRK